MGRATAIVVQRAWLGTETLTEDVRIEIEDGVISAIEPGSTAAAGERRLPGVAMPGLVNTHSHAFHRALRGMTHRQGGDFWMWRERMYELAAQLTPESYEELATAVYAEMAMAGITTVGEFHYLHHQPGGQPYDDPNEMGHALVRAAREAGIRICLLDAGYLTSGFENEPLNRAQERFSDGTVGRWLERVGDLEERYRGSPDVRIGLAPHSVRALPEPELVALGETRPDDLPLHVHVSEQPAENHACITATGLTPVGLLDRVGLLGETTTAVHATHVTPEDIETLAESGAGVCYCPTTERDLADGLGPSGDLHRAGIQLSVGSDSHAVIDLFEEARGVELHERLRSGRRGVFSPSDLARIATSKGARSLGFESGHIEVGAPADLIMVSQESVRTEGADEIASIVFAATSADVTDVIVGGRQIVSGGHHRVWERARMALSEPGR